MAKILFIDDEELLIEYSIKFFSRRDHQVSSAYSGEEGLKLIKEIQPDLVILDLKMEGMSGIDVLKVLRKEDSNTKVLILSGQDDFETQEEAKKYKINGFVSKPIDLHKLETMVNDVLSTKQ